MRLKSYTISLHFTLRQTSQTLPLKNCSKEKGFGWISVLFTVEFEMQKLFKVF